MSEDLKVTITLKEYNNLLATANLMIAMDAAGVDNWEDGGIIDEELESMGCDSRGYPLVLTIK